MTPSALLGIVLGIAGATLLIRRELSLHPSRPTAVPVPVPLDPGAGRSVAGTPLPYRD